MKRRVFLKSGLAAAAAGSIAAPALAQSTPQVNWRLASSFPKSLDTIYGACETFSRYVSDLTDGRFRIQAFAGGEIVPPLGAIDAVTVGTIEMCHSVSFYNLGKDPTWAIGAAMPFGLNARQKSAWLASGGQELLDEFYAKANLVAFAAGDTGAQMGGWFRREIKNLDDMKGLKFRVTGLTGQILTKLGAVPQAIPASDIYTALERGTIDAAEWVGPYDDEKLGFVKVAPFYYFPGWWEGSVVVHNFVNQAKWAELPKSYQSAIRIASQAVHTDMLAKYDAKNPAALRRLVASGAQLRPFSRDILDASYKAALEIYAEISGRNPGFKKIFDSYWGTRSDAYLWQQISDYSYDTFNIATRQR
jgi:TRAP-type mannitol/chloroaromatic compound transport system substrate-binding protein